MEQPAPSANLADDLADPMASLERMWSWARRRQLELKLFRRLPAACCEYLTVPVARPDCRACRDIIDSIFLDPGQPDDAAVENAYAYLASRDGCDGADELRRAEAARLLNADPAPGALGSS
jgi:hypothetical protein